MKKFASLLLSILLLASCVGCSMPGIGDDSGIATTEKAQTVIPDDTYNALENEFDSPSETAIDTEAMTGPFPVTTSDPGYVNAPIEITANFHGETVKILYGKDAVRNEFDLNETGEIVDDAIYCRNLTVEDILNVKFEWTGRSANGTQAIEYFKFASATCAAGEGFDLYAATRRAMSQMLTSGLLQDFNLIENGYINLSRPWYYVDAMREDLTIGGANFLAVGDISANAVLQTNVIFYNMGLAKMFGKTDPVTLVLEGRWTLDALIELSSDVYVDKDKSGSKTAADDYGFTQISYLDNDAFYSGSDMKFMIADPTGEGYVKFADDLTSVKAGDLSAKLFAFLDAPSSYVESALSAGADYSIPFKEDRALFCHGMLALADTTAFDFEHGILPIPKYDLNQEQYVTTLSDKAVYWGIGNYLFVGRSLMSSAVIEAMSTFGYRDVTPAIFENVMKMRFSDSKAGGKADMFELILKSVRIDLGKFLQESRKEVTFFAQCVSFSADKWGAELKQVSSLLTKCESELNNSIAYAIEEQQK